MDRLRAFGYFWYDFVIGDDWLMAAGVVVALVITFVTVRAGIAAWPWLPLLVILVLIASLWRATSTARR